MSILIAVVQLVVFLIKGADFFVDGSSAIARRFHVPTLIIGMTIVAMGTSLPELSVSVAASVQNNNSLSVSNVTGSDLFNIMVALGACAVVCDLEVTADVLRRDFPFYILSTVVFLAAGLINKELSRVDGIVLLVIFAVFLGIMIRSARQSPDEPEGEGKVLTLPVSLLFIIGGAAAIKLGGDWVVAGAVEIARAFGVTETLIGLTIVAFGTSLPEFVTSLVAARKNELDMAIGNVLGSNIFNILLILGVASVLSPIPFIRDNIIDVAILLAVSVIVWIFAITKRVINRWEGLVMVALYGAYLVYIIRR